MLRKASARRRCCAAEEIKWKPVKTKIYTMIPFTWTRCLFFLGSITLYATDVVRSGLGIQHVTSFGNHHLGIDTFSSFGPYAYPVQTILKNDSQDTNGTTTYFGFAENDVGRIDHQVLQVKLWPYKFDTLTVGLRGLAMELDVKEYLDCLLTTFRRCPSENLSLEQVFSLLDGLVEGIHKRLEQKSQDRMVFGVQHQWVDTVEQALFTYLRKEVFNRFFTLHSYRQNATQGIPVGLVDVCRRSRFDYDRPSFCTTASWPTAFPVPLTNPNEMARTVNIDEHIALRFARLQADFPDLQLEMVLLTASHLQFIQNSVSVYYSREGEEIVSIIRGRRCDSFNAPLCETVLVDDYRYERSSFDTNVEEMYGYVSFLRGSAQAYVWLRLLILAAGVAASTSHESSHDRSNLAKVFYMSCVNLLKVPSHVVVYGTLVPVVLHASAHLVDCYLYHLIVQDALGTLMGKDALLNVRTDLRYVTLKMRNIWFIGLLCILIVWYRTHIHQREKWKHRMGIIGFRGSMISFLACSSLLFPVRFPSLRQIDVLSFTWHDVNWTIDGIMALVRRDFSAAETGPFLEIRCFLLAVSTFMALLLLTRAISRLTDIAFPPVMAQSTLIPYSAGTLWSTVALTGYWITNIEKSSKHVPRPSVAPTCQGTQSQHTARRVPSHIRALRVETRSEEVWALIRLMNIVMMTNPWVYIRLRYIGVDLYLYRLIMETELPKTAWAVPNAVSDAPDRQQVFLLPERMEQLYEMNQLEFDGNLELVGVVNSRNIAWHQLIMCG